MGKTYRKEERKQHRQKKRNRKSNKQPVIPKYHYDDYVSVLDNKNNISKNPHGS